MTMLHSAVESSNIREIGWENETLYVTFHKSGTYSYHKVPVSVYEQMLQSNSVGSFLHKEVKGRYGYALIDPPQSGGAQPSNAHFV